MQDKPITEKIASIRKKSKRSGLIIRKLEECEEAIDISKREYISFNNKTVLSQYSN